MRVVISGWLWPPFEFYGADMTQVVKVTLDRSEFHGLVRICETELRSTDAQLRHLLRRELERRGLTSELGRTSSQGSRKEDGPEAGIVT